MSNRAWGSNQPRGVLGLGVGNSTIYRTPQAMAVVPEFVEIDVGHFLFGVGLTASGDVYVWGDNKDGILGDGTTDTSAHATPVQVSGVSNIVKIGTISEGVLALDNAGDLYGWGAQRAGEMGLGDLLRRTTPTLLATDVVDFSGVSHLLILKTGGVVQSAGRNTYGYLGTGNQTSYLTFQTVTPGSGTVVQVAVLESTSYLRMADGSVLVCGLGSDGQLGFVPTPFNVTPTLNFTTVPSLSNVVLIGLGRLSTFFKLSDDTVWALGNNTAGCLGVGQTFAALNKTYSLLQMIWPTGVTPMAFGQSRGITNSNIALGSDHLAYTWGAGASGQMGDGGSTATNHTPISVNGLVYVNVVGGGGEQLFTDALDVAPSTGRSFVSIVG